MEKTLKEMKKIVDFLCETATVLEDQKVNYSEEIALIDRATICLASATGKMIEKRKKVK